MDLSTGPGLVAAIAETIVRDDLSATIPAWVRLCEAGINTSLRHRGMLKRATANVSKSYVALPGSYLEMKSIHVNTASGSRSKLVYATPERFDDITHTLYLDPHPKYYTIIGNQLEIGPVPNAAATVEMLYYAAVDPLDLTTPGATNWLLTSRPGLYFYGSLVHSAPYLGEDNRVEIWEQFAGAIDALNTESERAEHSGSKVNMRYRRFG